VNTRRDERVRRALTGAYFASLLIFVVAALLGEPHLWGVNWYGFLPRYSLVLIAVVGVVAFYVARRFAVSPPKDNESEPASNRSYYVTALLIIAVFAVSYLLFRTRTHFLGDGYQVLAKLDSGEGVIKPWNVAVHLLLKYLMALMAGATDAALKTFRVISVGSGVLALVFTVVAARYLRDGLADRLLFLLGIATGGFTLLYFGYVEYYPLFATAVLTFLLSGLMVLDGALNRWWALPPLLLAGLCHPYSVALVPAALYLFLRDTAVGRRLGRYRTSTRVGIGTALAVALVAVLYLSAQSSYFFRFAILPVVTDRFTLDGYTMFSLRHLSDLINLLFVLVPSLVLLLVAVLSRSFRSVRNRPSYRFLFLAGLTALALVFVFDPKLGMPRDWDLFSFAGLPPLLLTFYLLTDRRFSFSERRGAAVMAIALGLMLLFPRVATQVQPERSIALFDSYSALDPLRNESGRVVLIKYLHDRGQIEEAERRSADNETGILHKTLSRQGADALQQRNYGQALTLLRRTTVLAPNWWGAWGNLGFCYLQLRQLDSAETALRIADGLNPFSPLIYNYLALLYLARGDYDKSENYCRGALRINPEDPNARGTLLRVYQETGRLEEYRNLANTMVEEESAPPGLVMMVAGERLRAGDVSEAVRLYRRALALGVDTAQVRQIEQDHPGLRIIP